MLRRFAILYLTAQAAGALLWWWLLLAWPESRSPFKASDAPDSTLLSFAVADFLLFTGASAASACGLWARRSWAWPVLCVHAGGAAYAALYCWTLFALTGGGLLGAALMTPSLFVPGVLTWRLRPGGDAC